MASKPEPKFPEAQYDLIKGTYWFYIDEKREYIQLNSRDIKLHAYQAGFPVHRKIEGDHYTEGDFALWKLQVKNGVRWVGPLAGHKVGPLTLPDGSRILVTREIQPVKPADVPFPFIERYLHELFGDTQLPYVLAWLKIAHASLSAGKFQPGQMLALGGKANSGKSLFHHLITMFLGGRSAKPFRYMSGQTNFNADLACAEHLFVEDEDASYDIRSRRKFGTAIKDFTVNEYISVHAKGYEAVTLPFWRRLTCSFNDEAENIMILPPMDESILDKIMLFRCGKATLPLDREKIQKTLAKELPGLAFHVVNYAISKSQQEQDGKRFGVRSYHDPELMARLGEMSAEAQLLSIIDEVIFAKDDGLLWRGSAEGLSQRLLASPANFTAQKIFTFASACGNYLARLRVKFPDRFKSVKNIGRTVWEIKPPEKE